jgi:hypothetical protein
MKHIFAILIALLAIGVGNRAEAAEEKVKLTITGGHETDPRDHGRPVVLIANALGVTPEVFRDTFSRVKPAPAGREPEPEQVQRNKAALLGALSRYGVTNELLDRVSNYYRYQPGSGRLWPTKPATAFATIQSGKVTAINITDPGAGYSSPPKILVPGHPEIVLKATPAFCRDLKTNGSLAAISVESAR